MNSTRGSTAVLRTLNHQKTHARRSFQCSARYLQEETQSTSSSAPPQAANAVAALRKRLGQQGGQDTARRSDGQRRTPDRRTQGQGQGQGQGPAQGGDRRRYDRGNQDNRGARLGERGSNRPQGRDARGGASRPGGQRQGQRSGNRRDGDAPSRRPQSPARRDQTWDPDLEAAPIQSVIPSTNWQKVGPPASQSLCRVPYATPATTLESFKQANNETKKARPLYVAEKGMRLHLVGKRGTVLGPVHAPTPALRARRRDDDAPTPARSAEGQGGSIASETKEARIQYMKEKFGGDYHRWGKTSTGKPASAVEGHAAEAVTHNADLSPSIRAWTLDTVQKIVGGGRQ